MTANARRRAVASVVMLCMGVASVGADESKPLEALLHDKGILSDAEYAGLQPSSMTSAVSPAVRVGGRIMIDAAAYDRDDIDLSSGTEVRRARLFVKGDIGPEWFYKFQYDFTGSGSGGFRDLYLGYAGLPHNTSLKVGQFFEYGSLEDSTSSRYITFMERALPLLAFVPAERRIGAGLDTHGTGWYAGAGAFGESAAVDESRDDGVGASLRAALAPVHAEDRTVHLGAYGQWRQPGDDVSQLRARPESHVSDVRLVDTGAISNVNDTVMYGLEAAWVAGPFSLQGEYVEFAVHRDGFSDETYDGYYIYGSYFLTGESRPYDPAFACFERVRPKRSVGAGGLGAWEVALRFSSLDLSGTVDGGEVDNLTAGLNWYTTPYTRFMLNYIRSAATTGDGADLDVDTIAFRAQVDF